MPFFLKMHIISLNFRKICRYWIYNAILICSSFQYCVILNEFAYWYILKVYIRSISSDGKYVKKVYYVTLFCIYFQHISFKFCRLSPSSKAKGSQHNYCQTPHSYLDITSFYTVLLSQLVTKAPYSNKSNSFLFTKVLPSFRLFLLNNVKLF